MSKGQKQTYDGSDAVTRIVTIVLVAGSVIFFRRATDLETVPALLVGLVVGVAAAGLYVFVRGALSRPSDEKDPSSS